MHLQGIKKKMGNFCLDIESLCIDRPGVYGLVGPNGSGKTTLAKIITGILDRDSGSMDLKGLKPKDITLLSRKPYMLDDNVYNNLIYPLKLRKAKIDTLLINEQLEKIGLLDRKKQRARLLSGGEQQKLSLMRALIFKPRLIIADEAMTAMDIDSLEYLENMLLEEQKKDPIIWIIISHQIPHIKRLTDYIFFMYRGRLESENSESIKQYLKFYAGSDLSKGSLE